MFFKSKIFKLLLPLIAYLLFAFQWGYNYMAVWYANIPEETTRFKTPYMGQYMMFAYLFAISSILFIILGVMYMVSHPVKKYVLYSLTAILIFSSYYVWLYSVTIKGWHVSPFLQFGNLVLFALAVFKLNK